MTARPDFYHTSLPPEPLRKFIDSFWLYEGYCPTHERERVLPTGTLELVFPLAGQRLVSRELTGEMSSCQGALVCGPRRSAFDVPTDQQLELAGVHFRPGGAWPFFGIPMDALSERNVPLEDLWSRTATELTERLAEAPTPAARLSLLGTFFLDRLARGRASHRAVRATLRRVFSEDDTPESISSIVASSGLSHRRFIELFRREIGLTPHDFKRVQRFQRAFSLSRRSPQASSAQLAMHAGYFDQSHWLLECKKLTKMSPSSLLLSGREEAALPDEERGQMLPIRQARPDATVTA